MNDLTAPFWLALLPGPSFPERLAEDVRVVVAEWARHTSGAGCTPLPPEIARAAVSALGLEVRLRRTPGPRPRFGHPRLVEATTLHGEFRARGGHGCGALLLEIAALGDIFCAHLPAFGALAAPADGGAVMTVVAAMMGNAFEAFRAVSAPAAGGVHDEAAALRQRLEAERQLVAIAGHDLRSPLSAILHGTMTLLRRGTFDPSDAATAQSVVASAQRATHLLRDLFDFSRHQIEGAITVRRQPADLAAVLDEVVAEAHLATPGRAVHLFIVGRGEGEWDSDGVTRIASNLIDNALKHGGDGPVIVELDGRDDHAVVLAVHNNGAPIPVPFAARIFDPHIRGHGAGLGLGLFIVKRIAEAHGGTVAISSNATDGTRFTVRLPRR